MYRVTVVVGGMDWVELALRCSNVLPSYAANSAKSHLPKQNLADSGISKIIVNPTQPMSLTTIVHPVMDQ